MTGQTLLTEEQAAEYAGVNRKTIRKLILAGRLEASNYGTKRKQHYRIHPDALANIKPVPPPAPIPRQRRRRTLPTESDSWLPRVDEN
jgi:excisionase family DNA binding protein